VSGPRSAGHFWVDCGPTCDAIFHILIEKDYDNEVMAWGVIAGTHEKVFNNLTDVGKTYIEEDEEETLYLIPIGQMYSPEEMRARIQEDIAQMHLDEADGEEVPTDTAEETDSEPN
jgi:hypothetical protein